MTRKERKLRMWHVKKTINESILKPLDDLVKKNHSVSGKEISGLIEKSVKKLLCNGSIIAPFMPNKQYYDLVIGQAVDIASEFNERLESLKNNDEV
ncbi:MAG: hypothetical protein ACXAC7_22675 [Candidatus Hodarchaeales archaeon]|jgi:hypothetical protein